MKQRNASCAARRAAPPRRSLSWLHELECLVAACLVSSGCSHHDPNRPTDNPNKPSASTTILRANVTNATEPGAIASDDAQVVSGVASRSLPAVVSVASTRASSIDTDGPQLDRDSSRRFFGPSGEVPFSQPPGPPPLQHGQGSGVLVAPDLILTNAHVVADAREIVVTAGDNRVLKATVAGADPKSDLAVLRVTTDTSGITPLEFGDSSALRLGEIVLAIGYPFGLSGTVTMGIVSAKGRANLGIADYEDFLQTDAAINPGNSGGALVDLQGRLVGIPTAILSGSGGNLGVGFAIPSSMARPIMNSLLERGEVPRGYLGATIQGVDEKLARALELGTNEGVLVSDVLPGSPAERAGLRRGDVIISIGGVRVGSPGELRNQVASLGATSDVELEIVRSGRRIQVRADVALMPKEPVANKEGPSMNAAGRAGLRLVPLDSAARERFDVPHTTESGLVVISVESGSPAAEAGIRPGDVLIELNRRPLINVEQLSEVWKAAKAPIALLVARGIHEFYVALEAKGQAQ